MALQWDQGIPTKIFHLTSYIKATGEGVCRAEIRYGQLQEYSDFFWCGKYDFVEAGLSVGRGRRSTSGCG